VDTESQTFIFAMSLMSMNKRIVSFGFVDGVTTNYTLDLTLRLRSGQVLALPKSLAMRQTLISMVTGVLHSTH